MKTFRITIASAALTGFLTVVPASAQDSESPWGFSVDTTFANRYLWRGFLVNDTPALQPNISVGFKGLSVSSWSNFAYRGPNGQNWTEHDLTVDYSHSFDKLGVSVGYIHYAFPDLNKGDGRYSHEFYGGISYDTLFSPSLTYYRDVDVGDGDYLYLSGGHSFELGKDVVLNTGLGAGLNHHQWQPNTTISNFDINVSVDIPWGKVVFSPFFTQMIGHRGIFGHHSMFGVNMSVIDF